MSYLSEVHPDIQRYFQTLEPDFPNWLTDYINTPELLKQRYISMTCGTIYSNLFTSHFFYSSLDHSVGVALIVWHFTHDKKQTLAGLFHDIATPVFKHCIDFLNGDYETQESTEDLTHQILANSKSITKLLKRDHIALADIDDYHLYPIADNDTPKLSADRLEYSLSNALFSYDAATAEEVQQFYRDLTVTTNEDGIDELAFQTKSIAKKFVQLTTHLSHIYMGDATRYSMQFLADIVKKLNDAKLLTRSDLYNLKESEVISIIEHSEYASAYDQWKAATEVATSPEKPADFYSVNIKTKIRYINPLAEGKRISETCQASHDLIQDTLSYDMDKYVYLNLAFN